MSQIYVLSWTLQVSTNCLLHNCMLHTVILHDCTVDLELSDFILYFYLSYIIIVLHLASIYLSIYLHGHILTRGPTLHVNIGLEFTHETLFLVTLSN